jgi:maleate cis-trans isomerase
MDPESKKLLEKTYELAEENNRMLRQVRSVQKRTALFQAVKALVVIGISIGAFYFLQPYVERYQQFIQETGMTIEKFKSLMPR